MSQYASTYQTSAQQKHPSSLRYRYILASCTLLTTLYIGLGATLAQVDTGPSFNCGLARAPIEHMICNNLELTKLDGEMGRRFIFLRSSISADAQNDLLSEQRFWLRSRLQECNIPTSENAPIPMAATECLIASYRKRLVILSGTTPSMPAPSSNRSASEQNSNRQPFQTGTESQGMSGSNTSAAEASQPQNTIGIIARVPCGALTSDTVARSGWGRRNIDDAPFGVPHLDWGDPEFNALKRRARECGAGTRGGGAELTRIIEIRQESARDQIARLRQERQQNEDTKRRITAELASIAVEPSAEIRLSRLNKLQNPGSGIGQMSPEGRRELLDAISTQREMAQDMRAEEIAARERENRLYAAEAEVRAQRQAVEQADAEAQLRQQKTQQASVNQAERDRRAEEARRLGSEREAKLQQLATEKAALDARRAEQEAQRAKNEAEARRLQERDEAELKQRQQQESRVEQDRVAREQTETAAKQQKRLEQIFSKHRPTTSGMGFPPGYLDADIMVDNFGLGYARLSTLHQWLSLLLESKNFSDIRLISAFNRTRYGVAFKQSGNPTINIAFRKDGNELYIDASGEGDEVSALTAEKQLDIGINLRFQVNELVQKVTAVVGQPSRISVE